jgi:hypothetical protein
MGKAEPMQPLSKHTQLWMMPALTMHGESSPDRHGGAMIARPDSRHGVQKLIENLGVANGMALQSIAPR